MKTDLQVLKDYTASFKSKTQAAKELGMSVQQLSNILNERTKIGAAIRERLREVGAYTLNVKQDTEPASSVRKLTDEREVYIRVLEIENRALKEKVETYEAYLTVKAK